VQIWAWGGVRINPYIAWFTVRESFGTCAFLASTEETKMLTFNLSGSLENDYFSVLGYSANGNVTIAAKQGCTIRVEKYQSNNASGQALVSTEDISLSANDSRSFTTNSINYYKFTKL
jgi:hypothetical protein